MNSYKQGLEDELEIMRLLSQYHTVLPSTERQNKLDDIDCYLDGKAVSIKSQRMAAKTGNLVFELEFSWRQTGEWEQSWYYNSKADIYIISVVDRLYQIDKHRLDEYVTIHGFDTVRLNTKKNRQQQAVLNHPHDRFKVGLLSLQRLTQAGIAQELFYADKGRSTRRDYIPKL